ncbi:glycosyltransferase family 1 protein [Bacteroides nordii]|uniref:glycosyltransferase family 1 protein n=1 Tax=Bacteroides nordii TaxID=291645 RepID=UPI0035230187
MVRVLHILGAMNRGGIETFIMNVYKTIDRDNIQFDFLVNSKNNDYAEEIEELGGKVYYIPPRNAGFIAFRKNIDIFFEKNKGVYCAVHNHVASLSSIYVLASAKKNGIKVRIVHSHSSNIKGSKLHYISHFFNKARIKVLATDYFACSDVARHWLFDYTGCFSRSKIINNGIITSDFRYDDEKRKKIREELKLKETDIAICHIGSFIPVKNQSFLIDVFSYLLKKSDKYKLFLVGDGILKKQIEEKVYDANIGDSVYFLGLRKDVNFLMQGFDCLVFPSLFEGLPVTLVEAQAADLRVVCSDNISKMAILLPTTNFLSLTLGPLQWAKIIHARLCSKQRKDNTSIIEEAGFDICTITEFLRAIYLNKNA